MKIALDIDHVIADITSELKRLHPEWCGTKYALPGLRLSEIDYSIATVLDRPDFDFDCYITSRPSYAYNITVEWLAKNDLPSKPVYLAHDKLAQMQKLGIDVLVDDKLSTFETILTKSNFHCLLYTQPWNAHVKSVFRVNRLNEVSELLELL